MASPESRGDREQNPDEGPELSVIVPCLNEELNLPELCERTLTTFERGGFWGEIVIVDDGSTDRTPEVIDELTRAHPRNVVGVRHPKNRGIAQGWRSGALASRGRLVATIDADLQYQPEDLLRLRRALYEHAVDLVQGYRSPVGRRRDERYTLSRGFNALLNGVFSMDLRDNKSGFVMCAREVLIDLLSYTGNYYYWQSFILVAAHSKGYAYREVETLFEERRQGVSFLAGSNAFKASARSFVDLARATVEYRTHRASSDSTHGSLGAPKHATSARDPESDASSRRWQAYMAGFNRSHFMITRAVDHQRKNLSKTEWSSRAELDSLGDEKLRRLVRHAYRNVPYYRSRMRELGLKPDDIRGRADLAKLPLLEKKEVSRNLYFDILSEDHDKDAMLRGTTSGARGEPSVFFVDRGQLELRWAAELSAREQTGYRFGDPWFSLSDPATSLGPFHPLRDKADARLSNRTALPSFAIDEAMLESMLAKARAEKPVLIEASTEALLALSHFMASTARERPPRSALVSYGQTLDTNARKRIEGAFGGPIFDMYGTRELGLVAHQCAMHADHHVVDEAHIVELMIDDRPANPGELGEIVVTDLANFCMPFLRYRTGDYAVAVDPRSPCACGRKGNRISAIVGRSPAIIVGLDGRYVPGSFFAHVLKDFGFAIQRYRVAQPQSGEVIFRFQKARRYSDEVLAEIFALFRQKLGRAMPISVAPFDERATDEGEAVVESELSRPFVSAW